MARLLTDNSLTIADLTRELEGDPYNMPRTTIRRYDANADVQLLLNKSGDAYPRESLLYWQKIAEARLVVPPLVEPSTAGRFLRDLLNEPTKKARIDAELNGAVAGGRSEANGDAGGALALPDAGREALAAFMRDTMREGVADGIKQAIEYGAPIRNDKLLTLKEARAETGLAESTIKTLPFVQETGVGGRRKWKLSILQKAIASF